MPNWARVGASGRRWAHPGSHRPPASPLQDTIQPERLEPSGAANDGASQRESGYFTWWLRGRDELPASSLYILNLAAGGKQSRRPLVLETPGPRQRSPCSRELLPCTPAQHKQTHLVPRANKNVQTRPQRQQPGAGRHMWGSGELQADLGVCPWGWGTGGNTRPSSWPHGVETEARRGEGPPCEGPRFTCCPGLGAVLRPPKLASTWTPGPQAYL